MNEHFAAMRAGRQTQDLGAVGDFIERIKAMGAIAVVVGDVSVRFPDALAPPRRAKAMTEEERLAIQEHSA